MTTNVSSYNSSGCGGCGSGGGNAYPAYSRMFVNSIEPCVNNGAIQLNLGQVTVDGTTNTTTVNGILDAKGSITTPDLDVTGTLNTTGPITAQEIITPELTVRTGTKDILVVTNNEVDIDALTTVYGDINQPVGSITTSMINSTNCQIGDTFFGYLTYDETTNELKVTDDTNSVNISTTSITAPGNIVCNMLGAGVANPTEKIDVLGNIKASGNINAGQISGSNFVSSGTIRSTTTSTNGMLRLANYVAGATGLSLTGATGVTSPTVFPWAGTTQSNFNFPISQSAGVFTNNTGAVLYILAFYNVYFSASNAGTWRKAYISKTSSTTRFGYNQQPAGANCTNAGTTCSGFAYFKLLNTETFQLNVQSDAALTMGNGDDCMLTVIAL